MTYHIIECNDVRIMVSELVEGRLLITTYAGIILA